MPGKLQLFLDKNPSGSSYLKTNDSHVCISRSSLATSRKFSHLKPGFYQRFVSYSYKHYTLFLFELDGQRKGIEIYFTNIHYADEFNSLQQIMVENNFDIDSDTFIANKLTYLLTKETDFSRFLNLLEVYLSITSIKAEICNNLGIKPFATEQEFYAHLDLLLQKDQLKAALKCLTKALTPTEDPKDLPFWPGEITLGRLYFDFANLLEKNCFLWKPWNFIKQFQTITIIF